MAALVVLKVLWMQTISSCLVFCSKFALTGRGSNSWSKTVACWETILESTFFLVVFFMLESASSSRENGAHDKHWNCTPVQTEKGSSGSGQPAPSISPSEFVQQLYGDREIMGWEPSLVHPTNLSVSGLWKHLEFFLKAPKMFWRSLKQVQKHTTGHGTETHHW